MTMAGDDPLLARAAWGAFYQRHIKYMYTVCLKTCGPLLGGEQGAADLAAETFKRAFEFAHTFEPRETTDPIRIRRQIRAWLGRISWRLAQNLFQGKSEPPLQKWDPEKFSTLEAKDHSERSSSKMTERARVALESLSEKEQIIIRTTLQWYKPGEPHQRLPNAVASDLAGRLKTTPENLRQIRSRAMKKLRSLLLDNGSEHKES